MSAIAVARDRWETLAQDTDRVGAARRSKELRRISDHVAHVASRMVHGCVGDEQVSLAELQHDLMLLLEERIVSWAAQVIEEREALGQSFGAQMDQRGTKTLNLSARAQ
jgi:hypothetical protein